MKWKFLIAILLMSLMSICYGENITVELVPSSIDVKVGDTFNLTLVVKNAPEDGKCAGFETEIHYDPDVLNLTEIRLSEVGESASLKSTERYSSYAFLTMAWLWDAPPYGNFTVATVSFKALNPGEVNITLKRTVVSNEEGYTYRNIVECPATVRVISSVIYVPDTYPTIQEAIDTASDGDIIIVRDGIYYENLVINKSIVLMSENGPENCIIDGNNSGDVIEIVADKVVIGGFTIRNSKDHSAGIKVSSNSTIIINNTIENSHYGIHIKQSGANIVINNTVFNNSRGIFVDDSINNTIVYNNILNNGRGVELDNSDYNIIVGNNITSNDWRGIYLRKSEYNYIGNNNLIDNWRGIYLYYSNNNCINNSNITNNNNGIELDSSNNNCISGNNIISNDWRGIELDSSNNNRIENNYIVSNGWNGIYLKNSKNNVIKGNNFINDGIFIEGWTIDNWIHTIENNTVNGKPLYYIRDKVGGYISVDVGQLILVNCSSIIVENQSIGNTDIGITIAYSSNITVRNSAIFNNSESGIYLSNSDYNWIIGNDLLNNKRGIYLLYSTYNSIRENNIMDNCDGIYLSWNSDNNSIMVNNIISNNCTGVYIQYSNTNTIKGNNFINDGIFIEGWTIDNWIHTIENNSINGKPLYYIRDKVGGYISVDVGQLILVNCSSIIVENQSIGNTDVGITIAYSSNITVRNSVIFNNSKSGIYLSSSNNNEITSNNLLGNEIGIYLSSSRNNIIYLNNFINNTPNAQSYYSRNNIWNSPDEITYTYNGIQYTNYLGNYWSDYTGNDTDGDGIGDTPYNNIDNYPLVFPRENYLILTNNTTSVPTIPPIIWNATISATNQLEPVIVGMHPNATDDYDEEFDEYTQLPLIGKVIMELDDIYAINIKRSVSPGSKVTWDLSVGVPSGTTTTLNWNKCPHPQVVLHIFNGTQELEPGCVLGEGDHSLFVVAEVLEKVSITLELKRGWNMISLPLIPDNSSVYEIFKGIPTLDTRPVLTWESPTFVPVDKIEPKRGYWVFTPEDINITVYGTPIKDTKITLKRGWNMIGTVGLQNLNLSLIPNQVPERVPVIWESPVFVPVTEIEPGKAAWVFVAEDTEVVINEG